MTVATKRASYVVPPQRAVWMPAGVPHRIVARTNVAMRTLYIEPKAALDLPSDVQVLHITPLMRELIIEAAESAPVYEPDTPQSRLMGVVLDQIAVQPSVSLVLPMPEDSRLLPIARSLSENPADRRGLESWSKSVGASTRTLSRLFKAQTGMSYRAWCQQCQLHRAIELLATGVAVDATATRLGYASTSAFIAMFRRAFGTTPARYFAPADE